MRVAAETGSEGPVKRLDPARLVTNSPGGSSYVTGSDAENRALDFLSPHTPTSKYGRCPHCGQRNWNQARVRE